MTIVTVALLWTIVGIAVALFVGPLLRRRPDHVVDLPAAERADAPPVRAKAG